MTKREPTPREADGADAVPDREPTLVERLTTPEGRAATKDSAVGSARTAVATTKQFLESAPARVRDVENKGLKIRMALASIVIFLFFFFAVQFLTGVVALFFGATVGGTGSFLLTLGLTIGFMALQYRGAVWMLENSDASEQLPREEHPEIYERTEALADRMGIEMPTLYVVDLGVPNAFALGRRNDGHVALTPQILSLADTEELEGIVAHELAHLRNRDALIQMFAVTTTILVRQIVSKVTWVMMWFVAVLKVYMTSTRYRAGYLTARDRVRMRRIVAGVTAVAVAFVTLFTRSLSRQREYHADATAAKYTDDGASGLASALQKVDRAVEETDFEPGDTADHVPTALCIHGSYEGILQRLFSTHPGTAKRLEKLGVDPGES